jgi:uncharacterized membrane protein YqjE
MLQVRNSTARMCSQVSSSHTAVKVIKFNLENDEIELELKILLLLSLALLFLCFPLSLLFHLN